MKYIKIIKKGVPRIATGCAGAIVGAAAGYLIGSTLGYNPESFAIIGLYTGGELSKRAYKHYFE